MSLKARIEAILFMSEKPMRAAAIARLVNEDVQEVRKIVLELIHDYEEREGGLEIGQDDGYIIQVKDEYSDLAEEMAPMEMPAALLRTLAAIAIRQPVMQSDIIRIRGAGAYEHVKQLVEQKLIIKKNEDSGRSPNLSTTRRFQEYFRLSKDGTDWRKYFKQQETIMRKQEEAFRKDTEQGDSPPADQAGQRSGQLGLPLTIAGDKAAAVAKAVESSPELKDAAAELVDIEGEEDSPDETEVTAAVAEDVSEVTDGLGQKDAESDEDEVVEEQESDFESDEVEIVDAEDEEVEVETALATEDEQLVSDACEDQVMADDGSEIGADAAGKTEEGDVQEPEDGDEPAPVDQDREPEDMAAESVEDVSGKDDGPSEESVTAGKVPDVQATNAGGETIA